MLNLWDTPTNPVNLGLISEREYIDLGIHAVIITSSESFVYDVYRISGEIPSGLSVRPTDAGGFCLSGVPSEVPLAMDYTFVLRSSLTVPVTMITRNGIDCFRTDLEINTNKVYVNANGVLSTAYASLVDNGIYCLLGDGNDPDSVLSFSGDIVLSLISDKTFSITIDGADSPTWLTEEGLLKISPYGHVFVPYNTPVSFSLSVIDSDIGAGSGFTYSKVSGTLPTGLKLSSAGVISGTVTMSSEDVTDELFTFVVKCTDDNTPVNREFSIYCVPEWFLSATNNEHHIPQILHLSNFPKDTYTVGGSYTADISHLRSPFWLTDSDMGQVPFGSTMRRGVAIFNPNTTQTNIDFFLDKLVISASGFIDDGGLIQISDGVVGVGDRFYIEDISGRRNDTYEVLSFLNGRLTSKDGLFNQDLLVLDDRILFGKVCELTGAITQGGSLSIDTPSTAGVYEFTLGAVASQPSKKNYIEISMPILSVGDQFISMFLPESSVPLDTDLTNFQIRDYTGNVLQTIANYTREEQVLTVASNIRGLYAGGVVSLAFESGSNYLSDFMISRKTFSVNFSRQRYGFFEWLSGSDLGTLKMNTPSEFMLSTTIPNDTYVRFTSGTPNNKLRNSLYLNATTGAVQGVISYENNNIFIFDDGSTVMDDGRTSFDDYVTFTATASAYRNGTVVDSITRTFNFLIKMEEGKYARLMMIPLIGAEDLSIYRALLSSIPNNYIYRLGDSNFGKVNGINILLHPAITIPTYTMIQEIVADVDLIRLRFDGFDVAYLDRYEVIFARMRDTREVNDEFIEGQDFSSFHQVLRSIDAAIEKREDMVYDYTLAPDWMKIINIGGLGYGLAIAFPVAFCVKGKGYLVKNILEANHVNKLNQISFVCDRISSSSIMIGSTISKTLTILPFGGRSGNYFTKQH